MSSSKSLPVQPWRVGHLQSHAQQPRFPVVGFVTRLLLRSTNGRRPPFRMTNETGYLQRGGNIIRFLKVVIVFLAFAVITPAFAQVCCPDRCVQDGNRCVHNGTQNTCAQIACPPTSGGGGSNSGSSGFARGTMISPPAQAPLCQTVTATQTDVDAKINQCLNALTANAILFSCFLENDHNRAEDQRTGLTCGQRQIVLARQCRKRCTDWANYSATHWRWYRDDNPGWQKVFQDIGGNVVGAASVERCGPRLPSLKNKPQPRRTP